MISSKRTVIIGGLLAVVIFGWYHGLHRFPDLDRCLDSGGRWVGGWNECECPAGELPKPGSSWCLPTLTAEIQNAERIVRGRCVALERRPDTSSGTQTGQLTIEFTPVIAGSAGGAENMINVPYEGGRDHSGFCSGDPVVIAMYGTVPSERVFQHSFVNLFPVFRDSTTSAEYVAVTFHHGFALHDADTGQPYSISWDQVPYSDFIYSLERALAATAPKGS